MCCFIVTFESDFRDIWLPPFKQMKYTLPFTLHKPFWPHVKASVYLGLNIVLCLWTLYESPSVELWHADIDLLLYCIFATVFNNRKCFDLCCFTVQMYLLPCLVEFFFRLLFGRTHHLSIIIITTLYQLSNRNDIKTIKLLEYLPINHHHLSPAFLLSWAFLFPKSKVLMFTVLS